MLTSLRMQNFKRFERFSVSLSAGNVLVGPNNSGKSSILDAFRILGSCIRFAQTRSPSAISIPSIGIRYGYNIPDTSISVDLSNICHNYSDADAILEFRHKNGSKAFIYLNPMNPTRFFLEAERSASSKKLFLAAFPVDLIIVPTLAPLEAKEEYVLDETVQRNRSTRLASRNFRNIWLRSTDDEFDEFKTQVEIAWKDVSILKPELVSGKTVQMFYTERRISREVNWSGFGFQIWLQILTHLLRRKQHTILVIDEPDIYLHPDLQHKLLILIRKMFSQFLIATHSIEIINESNGEEILSINSNFRAAKRLVSDDDFNSLSDYLGSSNNLDLARISKARKIIFFEGKDIKIIRKIAKRLGFNNLSDNINVPIISLGGFTQWRKAANAAWAFKNIINLDISVTCIFDRDYRTETEVKELLEEFQKESIEGYVLPRKEIENFLIDVDCICESILRNDDKIISKEEILKIIIDISGQYKEKILGQICMNELASAKRKQSHKNDSTIITETISSFENLWSNINDRMRIVPGKTFITDLNSELQKRGIKARTISNLSQELKRENIDAGFLAILASLDRFCS